MRGIIFDLDGVICHTDGYHFKAWKKLADQEGIYFDEEINNRLRGVSRMESLEIILERAKKIYSQEEKEKMAIKKNEYYVELLKEMSKEELSKEVSETLEELRNRGYKLAIGSSSKNTKYILSKLGLDNYFDAISDGTNIVNSKPDPEVFLKAAGMIGEKPEDCLVVEDAKAGIEAACAGKFVSAGLGEANEHPHVTYQLKDFSGLLDICKSAYVDIVRSEDIFRHPLTTLWVDNGALKFSLILERGFDVGEVYAQDEKVSWDRNPEKCLSDQSVNLNEEGGWELGFYAAVTTLGPQLFGTPDEKRTVHGTGAYSPFSEDSIEIWHNGDEIKISATGMIKGFAGEQEYEKKVVITTRPGSYVFAREEYTRNLTDKTLPIDDGYHIQMGGDYVKSGGEFVLPVRKKDMLIRDMAPMEENPKEIYAAEKELSPIRCYQYVPNPVRSLEQMIDFCDYWKLIGNEREVTGEMLVNHEQDRAVAIIRPLDVFPRSLLAKRNLMDDDPMYALEPCKTRPNSIKQKEIDGELMYLKPRETKQSVILIGYMKKCEEIKRMRVIIEKDNITGRG